MVTKKDFLLLEPAQIYKKTVLHLVAFTILISG